MLKKTKLLIGDHSPRWYLLYSAFSALIIIGFFYVFSYYSGMPKATVTGFQTAEFSSIDDLTDWQQSKPIINEDIYFPPMVYLSMVIIAVGVVGFLATKFFYIKNSSIINKRTGVR